MAAAYAALVSLTHLIEQIMEHHARQPLFLDKEQRQIESLTKKVTFLHEFLEVYQAERLVSRIADAAYDAEDVIESHVVDKISLMENSSSLFSQDLHNVLETIGCIMKEVTEVKEKIGLKDQQPGDRVPVVSSRPPSSVKDKLAVEYYNEELEQIMDKLTGQSSDLQIIPIVGMGGIGKTTLARSVYENPLIQEYFYIRAWATISQEYNLQEMLLGLLHEAGAPGESTERESDEFHQLGEKFYKHLSGRKYLIVLDDVWSVGVWDKLKLFLPNSSNGSRVLVTTRLSNVANGFSSSGVYKMNLLDENQSWDLLCRNVFSNNDNCPPELVKTGKDIAKNCKGLPLSIVVIGGLLAKSEMTRECWEGVHKDINQIVNSEDDGHWLKILSLSYNQLPIYLKPCFLYMGIYPEDREIRVSKLIKLWVAEGFLKPNKVKSMEEVARDYLEDLIERNLILVRKWGSIGKMKTCGIHDLVRDLCLKEAQKERFICVVKLHNRAQHANNERRIIFHDEWSHEIDSNQFHLALQSTPFIRSLTCDFEWSSSWQYAIHNLKLLRVFTVANPRSALESILQLVNLRYLKCDLGWGNSVALSSMCRFWYLQTLIFTGNKMEISAPDEIWEMPQLRHIISAYGIFLPDPLCGQRDKQDNSVLKNLQTLSCARNLKCTEEVLRRIPNIKKLSVELDSEIETGTSNYYLHNLDRLRELQSLTCHDSWSDLFRNVTFPESLQKLTLSYCCFGWNDITTKVGSLPRLEKLRLIFCKTGSRWNTVEGKFLSLKFLDIGYCDDLLYWTSEGTHFPHLEHLVLKSMNYMKKIPSDIGHTLKSIELVLCRSSIIASAREILNEQLSLENEGLRLIVQGSTSSSVLRWCIPDEDID